MQVCGYEVYVLEEGGFGNFSYDVVRHSSL